MSRISPNTKETNKNYVREGQPLKSKGVALAAGDLCVELLPSAGGSIARFDRMHANRRQPLFRGRAGGSDDVLAMGCFPLVPFANRIRGGAFSCDGRDVCLTPNLAGDVSPLHGQGWRAPWATVEKSERAAVLSFSHEAGEWPWHYDAEQRIELDPNGLSLTLSCINRSAERMPCGLGFHPYYPCDAETVLDTRVERAWTVDDLVLPVESVAATGRYDLRERRICGQSLDHGFDGWGGEATIRWAGEAFALRLSSRQARRFQVYSPPEGGYFAAEPVQNANAALNAPPESWPDLGISWLATGEKAKLAVRFDVIRIEA